MYTDYMGIPGTICGLGILLYNLLSADYPFTSMEDLEFRQLNLSPDASQSESKQKHHMDNNAIKYTLQND